MNIGGVTLEVLAGTHVVCFISARYRCPISTSIKIPLKSVQLLSSYVPNREAQVSYRNNKQT
jgi:hypothetical protein